MGFDVSQLLSFLKENSGGVVTVLAVFAVGVVVGRAAQKLSVRSMIQAERADAVKRSRAVIGGQVAEQLAPYFPGFPCNPADAVFIGKPVDFVAFPGCAEGKPVREVLLIEVKTGQSQLSPREKDVRTAVQQGRVRYVEYRLP